MGLHLAVGVVAVATACAPSAIDGQDRHAATTRDTELEADTTTPPPSSTQPSSTTDLGTPSTTRPAPKGRAPLPAGEDTAVARIVDGDTLVVAGGVRVRLIGIDTPETKDPRRPVECFGAEASRRLGELAPPGTPVRLVHDVARTDRYGRTLAYLYRLPDGLFVNAALVREGFALVATYPPNVAFAEELVALERKAREEGAGLWQACPADRGVAPARTATTPAPAPGSAAGLRCHPSYPDFCIPPAPPDLDCKDVEGRNFTVRDDDPHGFDRDGDGVGCES